jgi:hypothetical protein
MASFVVALFITFLRPGRADTCVQRLLPRAVGRPAEPGVELAMPATYGCLKESRSQERWLIASGAIVVPTNGTRRIAMRVKKFLYPALIASSMLVLAACQPPEGVDEPYVVEIVAVDYAFAAPAEIPSGWVTLRLDNQRDMEIHEISLARLPDDVDYETYLNEVIRGWELIWDGMRQGEITLDEMNEAIGKHLPEWALDVEYVNARNLLSAGRQSESILRLEPGTYALECWIKTADGDIHISHGMIHELTVTEEDSGAPQPEADVALVLDADGVQLERPLQVGRQTIAVDLAAAEDGTPVRNDVHLIRIADDTNLAEVVAWLDWYDIERGLREPAPADFLGGFHAYNSMPDEGRAWFTVNVDEAGRYAWVMEGDPADEPWQIFEVE